MRVGAWARERNLFHEGDGEGSAPVPEHTVDACVRSLDARYPENLGVRPSDSSAELTAHVRGA